MNVQMPMKTVVNWLMYNNIEIKQIRYSIDF